MEAALAFVRRYTAAVFSIRIEPELRRRLFHRVARRNPRGARLAELLARGGRYAALHETWSESLID